MNLSTISVLFLLELSAVCHGLTNPCRRKFEEGLEKCFDDSVGTQVDVIQTLMGSSQNPGSTETICSKKSQILSCVTKVLTNVTSSATCEKDLTEITMITGLSARLQTLIGVLCTETPHYEMDSWRQ